GELFLVKHRGGGLILTGDIFAPSVTRLPGVQSTGTIYGRADAGEQGVLYCSYANGAWLWNGSNTAEKVSQNLDDNFFLPPEFATMGSNNYAFFVQCIGDKAYFSNNWIYDMTYKSWWKYYPDTAQGGTNLFWVNPVSGPLIYAANLSFTASVSNDFLYAFNTAVPSQHYRWTSLPLRLGGDDQLSDIVQFDVRASCP